MTTTTESARAESGASVELRALDRRMRPNARASSTRPSAASTTITASSGTGRRLPPPSSSPVPSSPANRGYQPGFTAAMMLKDLLLAQAAAKSTGAKAPMAAGAAALYDLFVDQGNAGMDFSGIIKLLDHE